MHAPSFRNHVQRNSKESKIKTKKGSQCYIRIRRHKGTSSKGGGLTSKYSVFFFFFFA